MPVKKLKPVSKKNKDGRKKRVREHIIADLSANYVERFALLNGFSVECIGKDYGYDLNIYTFDSNGEFENGNVYVQLKATDHPKYMSQRAIVSFPTNRRDLKTWYAEPFPVIFILYDAKNEIAFWIYIQQYLRNLANFDLNKVTESFTVNIPVANVIDQDSFQKFRIFKKNTLNEINNVIHYK